MRLTSNRTHIHFPARHSCHLSSSPQLPGLTNKDVMSLPVLRDITNPEMESLMLTRGKRKQLCLADNAATSQILKNSHVTLLSSRQTK